MLELTGELAMESDDIEGLEAAKTRFQLFGMPGGKMEMWSIASEDSSCVFDTVDGSEIRRETTWDGAKTL